MYCGFVVEFEPERSNRLAGQVSAGYDITDSFSLDDWPLGRKELFFLIAPPDVLDTANTLIGMVYVERMHGMGGTRKPKYRLTRPVLFEPSIQLAELARNGISLEKSISNPNKGLRLSQDLWGKLVACVCGLRPNQAEELWKLLSLVVQDTQLLGGGNKLDRLAEQRDAIGMVLDMTGLDRSPILKAIDVSKADDADVFFDLLTNHPYQERSLIEHDEYWLNQLLSETRRGITFSDSRSAGKVSVRITDKEPLETALGVDLLIYQSLYNSLIFVQYKAMNKEGKEGWVYRPDGQLDKQFGAMHRARIAMRKRGKISSSLAGMRLNDEPFYFKFCERRKPDAAEASLVSGLSMNALHVEEFLALPQAKGPNGGEQIGYRNCHRYLNNTEFVTLAKGGWIGTTAEGSDFMKEVVTASFERKHAVVYALIDIPEQSTAQLRKKKGK